MRIEFIPRVPSLFVYWKQDRWYLCFAPFCRWRFYSYVLTKGDSPLSLGHVWAFGPFTLERTPG